MAFNIPTLQEIVTRIESDFKSRISGATTFLRRSILKVFSRVYGGAIFGNYGYLDDNRKQIFITEADADSLLTHGSEYGISKKSATSATGSGSGTGTNDSIIPVGSELRSATGAIYTVDSAVTIALGVFSVDITSQTLGSGANEDASASLSFVSPIDGVSTSITIDSSGITGGLDEETDDDYRDRILTRKRIAPQGGALIDYENWALEISGVTRAWAFERYYGRGTVGLAFARDDDDSIAPDSDERDVVKAYIESHTSPITGKDIGMPVTAQLIMIETKLKSINITVKIIPNNATVQAAILESLDNMIIEEGGPGQTVELSKFTSAIASAVNEDANQILIPTDDVAIATNEIAVIGTVTFQDY